MCINCNLEFKIPAHLFSVASISFNRVCVWVCVRIVCVCVCINCNLEFKIPTQLFQPNAFLLTIYVVCVYVC